MADWDKVNEALGPKLEVESPAVRLTSKEEFVKKVDDLVRIIYEVLQDHIDEKSPNPFKQRWWTKDLTLLKKTQNRLTNKSHKLRHVHDHPIHAEYKAASNKFKEVMTETRSQDWTDWLEGASQQDLYLANKYISSEPSDYSNTRIPALHILVNGLPDLAEDNDKKVEALAKSFFPPPTGIFVGSAASGISHPIERAALFLQIKNSAGYPFAQSIQSPGPGQDP
jgi:hypothetical protein